jgi:hypothetical protein
VDNILELSKQYNLNKDEMNKNSEINISEDE